MATPVSSIRNLGPAMQEAFENAGIRSAEDLREMGADNAYSRLLASGHPAHFIAYYALVMGLQGRPWNDCGGDEKSALRLRFDALKAARPTDTPIGIEKILNDIGVRPARR